MGWPVPLVRFVSVSVLLSWVGLNVVDKSKLDGKLLRAIAMDDGATLHAVFDTHPPSRPRRVALIDRLGPRVPMMQSRQSPSQKRRAQRRRAAARRQTMTMATRMRRS